MKKSDLIKELAKVLNTPKEAEAFLNSLQDWISLVLAKGESITLPGFGTFKVSQRKPRTGVNPRTGEKIKINAKTVVRFVPSKKLNAALN